MEYINAFWVGGLICALVQILLDRTKMMPGRVMVMLVCLGGVLGRLAFMNLFWTLQEAEPASLCWDLAMSCGRV